MSSDRAQFGAESDGGGRFIRQESAFRDTEVTPERGRYHLYVSLACPWAHRAIIVRRLNGLEDAIGMSVVDPLRDELGWAFRTPDDRTTGDLVNGWDYLSEAYVATDPQWRGRVSVPVLWDTEEGRIVNNESADAIVLLNSGFDAVAARPGLDLYPAELRGEMDPLMERMYENVNNGVYAAGFARSQAAYEEAVFPLFEVLHELDERLADRRYLLGDRLTLADVRLYTTLARFDAVYAGHFKCNLRRIADYPSLAPYLRDLFQTPGFGDTTDFDHIKRHYYMTHDQLNPSRIVPAGPILDLDAPHDRDVLGRAFAPDAALPA